MFVNYINLLNFYYFDIIISVVVKINFITLDDLNVLLKIIISLTIRI